MNADEKAIAAVLASYEQALNQSSTDAVMKLYAPDGVFMPQNSPSSVGADAVRKAYDNVFNMITLGVKFDIAEIHQLAPECGLRAHQFRGEGQGTCDRRGRAGGQSGTFRVPEDCGFVEDRALLFLHHQPADIAVKA